MNLAGYIRVSTEGQVDAYGKDVQRDAILRWAQLNGHHVNCFYEEDGVSGKTDGGDRPALASALEQVEPCFEGIVVFDATRIARRLYVQETLLALVWAAGLRVFTTTAGELEENDDDPTRIMIRQILGVIAEFDHRNTVKRLHAGRRAKASQGGFAGGTPKFGLAVEGTGKQSRLVPNAPEVAAIAKIDFWHQHGRSVRGIAAILNEQSVPTKTGKGPWHATQVARIINRPETTH